MQDKHTIKNAIEDKRQEIESKGGIVCDNFQQCHKCATVNIQECVAVWGVYQNGEYTKNPIDIKEFNGDNEHLCNECYNK